MKDVLTIEIIPELSNQFASVGVADFGEYRYLVKNGKRLIAEGVVHNPQSAHFSVLLKRVSEDAKLRELERITTS